MEKGGGRYEKQPALPVRILRSNPDEYKAIKILLGLPIGFGIGSGLYFLVLEQIEMPLPARHALGVTICVCLSLGYVISGQIRCIMWIIVPTMFGKSGRSFLSSIAIAYLISGPITDIIYNGKEIVRTLSCTSELMKNHSHTKYEFRRKPLERALLQLQEGFRMQNVSHEMKRAFAGIETEIEDQLEIKDERRRVQQVDRTQQAASRAKYIDEKLRPAPSDSEADKIERSYARKGEYRCQDIFSIAVTRCQKVMSSTYNKCLDKVPIIGYVLCVIFWANFVCSLLKLFPGLFGYTCDAMPVINPGFGEVYVKEKEMIRGMDSGMKINFQYKVVDTPEKLDFTSVTQLRLATMHEFEDREMWVGFLLSIVQRFLAFTFLLVVLRAYQYTKNYLSDLSFDNHYISSYFRHIDVRRKTQGKKSLLPLKKIEKKVLTSPWAPNLIEGEKSKFIIGTLMQLVWISITVILIIVNQIIFTVLDIIQNQTKIKYRQKGFQKISLKIEGIGFMSDVLRTMLKSFDQHHTLDRVSTNLVCQPNPRRYDKTYAYIIGAIFGLVWFLMLFQTYGLRLRRVVASFFFRQREKKRILFLYNGMLKKRRGFLHYMRQHVRKLAKEKKLEIKSSILNDVYHLSPKLFTCLKFLPGTRDRCLICSEPADKYFRMCTTLGCPFGYCLDCWIDIKESCYACQPDFGSESDASDVDE